MQNWTSELVLDRKAREHPSLKGKEDALGRAQVNFERRHALVGIYRSICREDDSDPLCTVMHEAAHVLLAFREVVDPDDAFEPLFEQATEEIGLLLYALWQAEHAEGGSRTAPTKGG